MLFPSEALVRSQTPDSMDSEESETSLTPTISLLDERSLPATAEDHWPQITQTGGMAIRGSLTPLMCPEG